MSKSLPPRPDIHWLKNRAKERRKSDPSIKLAAAQLAVARDYGFTSWRKLKEAVGAHRPDDKARRELVFKRFRTAVNNGDVGGLRRLLHGEETARELVNAPIFAFDSPAVVQAWRNPEIIDVLLEFGADINRKSSWWAGPWGVLDHADAKTAKSLIRRGARVDVFAAAKLGDVKRLREFLDADPSLVHAKGGDGCRPLHFAASARTIDLLLERGAEIDARDLDHESTAAQWAMGNPACARHLLKRGAEPDVFMAAALDDVKLLEEILDRDPSAMNARVNEAGYPPCPTAPGRHIYVYSMGDGKTPHQVAADHGSRRALAFLHSRSSPHQRFMAACSTGEAAAARAALASQPDLIGALKPQDQRALPDAAFNGTAEAVKLMLDLGFDPLARNKDGATALHCAAWKGRASVVRLVLNHRNARKLRPRLIEAVDNVYKAKPLDWCCHGSLNCREAKGDYPVVARLLLDAGASTVSGPIDASEAVGVVLKSYGRRART
jgi:ankyrin repeat protein